MVWPKSWDSRLARQSRCRHDGGVPAPRRIVFVVFGGLQSLDLSGPWEAFAAADRAARERSGQTYELLTASIEGGTVRASSGLEIGVDRCCAEIDRLDTLIVVGGFGTRAALADPALIAEIARLAAASRRVCSVCSGAFLLAEAGLLEGRRAVTHWAYCEQMASLYPGVSVDPDPIFIRDGNVFTSAGVTAGIDLALALVEDDLGPEVALEVARDLVVYARRPGGQSQFSVQLEQQIAATPPLRDLQGWIAENLDADLSVAGLAARVHLSERHFARLFRAEFGSTPADYVERARVERARQMLESGAPAGVETVALACGFAGPEVMRRAFQRRLGVSPREYRQRFQLSPVHA